MPVRDSGNGHRGTLVAGERSMQLVLGPSAEDLSYVAFGSQWERRSKEKKGEERERKWEIKQTTSVGKDENEKLRRDKLVNMYYGYFCEIKQNRRELKKEAAYKLINVTKKTLKK